MFVTERAVDFITILEEAWAECVPETHDAIVNCLQARPSL